MFVFLVADSDLAFIYLISFGCLQKTSLKFTDSWFLLILGFSFFLRFLIFDVPLGALLFFQYFFDNLFLRSFILLYL